MPNGTAFFHALKGGSMTKKVIDISNHNGHINWQKLKADGITGVIIRAGYGWYNADLSFARNVKEAQEHGFDYGLYFYTYATEMDEARQEIAGFLHAIRGLKPTYPVIIDTEDDDKWREKNGNPSWQTTADMLVMQLQEIEKAGYYAMWYTSKYWAQNLYRCRPDLKDYDLWLAQWDVDRPGLPCGMWQYTNYGAQYGDGIERSDLNISYVDYPDVIKRAGLNGWPKTKGKNMTLKDKHVVICFKNDGDLSNALALFNSLNGLCKTLDLRRGDPDNATKYVIQVGGAAVAHADKVLSGKDRREVAVNIGKFIAEVTK